MDALVASFEREISKITFRDNEEEYRYVSSKESHEYLVALFKKFFVVREDNQTGERCERQGMGTAS
jgi:hypothetical protein